ncbi:poly-gamma-glutamate hydrolase family protein [Streptomyces pacificus]|uniref:poly-gamma-glutamate hydrolase family protein n=1 Tax=Streptomyces pacificus TaxID=2705029 RepID=UPI0020B15593|nr:poly-gamma-glutamate hydrolase family protein [Streptomyces pacificus]
MNISADRRSVLTALVGAAVGGSVLGGFGAPPAYATGENDVYASNTDLYTTLAGREGTDFGRRWKRHQHADESRTGTAPFNRTTVMALHGGGIEGGTSELCLGIAGYHPATLETVQDGRPVHDYWMFEGLRSSGNRELHVTSTNCDDRIALALAEGSLNVLSLHGCTAAQAGAPASAPEAVVVGGGSGDFKDALHLELGKAGFTTIDGSEVPDLAGVKPGNPCNRTLLGEGAQLELTAELRVAMFGVYTNAGRPGSTTEVFWRFTAAARAAVARLEAQPGQILL